MEDISMKGATVRISADGMEAVMVLRPPEAGEEYTLPELVRYLRTQRVTEGIEEAAIQKMIEDGIYMREVCVAHGREPVHAQNGRYELNFNPNVDGKPKIKEDGSVDYWSIRTVEMVKEGQVIATYFPPTEAINGMTVTGKPVLATRGKPLQPLRGKGFHCEEDGCTYVADLSGKIEMNNGKIRISAIYEIQGDVGITTGHVDYHGDVVIHGGIQPGTVVRTSGSLTVDGICENCVIEAGKDILLRKGVLGGNKTSIRAGGNIHALFFEYCKVQANGYIEVSYALDSRMISYDHIYVAGKKGSIIGGYAYGISGIDVNVIGNSTEVKTQVHVGVTEQMVQELKEKTKAKEEALAAIEKITKGIKMFDAAAAQKGIDASKEPKRMEALRTRMKLQADAAEQTKEIEQLANFMERGKKATITVVKRAYSGIVVSIDQVSLNVKETQESVRFEKRKDSVVMISLV